VREHFTRSRGREGQNLISEGIGWIAPAEECKFQRDIKGHKSGSRVGFLTNKTTKRVKGMGNTGEGVNGKFPKKSNITL